MVYKIFLPVVFYAFFGLLSYCLLFINTDDFSALFGAVILLGLVFSVPILIIYAIYKSVSK